MICADEPEPVIPRTWLEDHPRIHHAFIPVGACRLNLQEGWWRIFRKAALADRSFANPDGSGEAQLAQPGPRPRGRPHHEVSRYEVSRWVRP
ncbi:hypothetical protein ACFYW9_37040 [Streptomyces sp. NPDC002698]|uniref:hypothetical protein n=1 Tax=Streptomyces sp. NPDC002698 TaxID=3364660 RepID=UPI00368C9DD6